MFRILDSIDSTNNYAMAMIHEGLASHGMAWFAHEQTAGKGQPGKSWESAAGQNIAISIAIKPPAFFFRNQFYFSAAIANSCCRFFKQYAGEETSIKWPNDLYWRDRKAGGILIENRFVGKEWKWATVGVGININQLLFSENLFNPVSLKQITGKNYDTLALGRELHQLVMEEINSISPGKLPALLQQYNDNLYKKHSFVRLKQRDHIFDTTISGVNELGQLVTTDTVERLFNHGEVEWVSV